MSKTAPERGARGRGNAELREESMQRILDTAIRHIAARGASKLSLIDVGRDSGYSHSLPTYYFKTKRQLVLEVCRLIIGAFPRRSGSWIQERTGMRPRPGLETVEATIRAYLALSSGDRSPRMRALHVLWAESCSSMPELLEVVRPFNDRSIKAIAEQLRIGVRQGEIAPSVDVEALALVLLGMLRGALAQYLLDPEHVDMERVADAMVALLRRGVTDAAPAGDAVAAGADTDSDDADADADVADTDAALPATAGSSPAPQPFPDRRAQ